MELQTNLINVVLLDNTHLDLHLDDQRNNLISNIKLINPDLGDDENLNIILQDENKKEKLKEDIKKKSMKMGKLY